MTCTVRSFGHVVDLLWCSYTLGGDKVPFSDEVINCYNTNVEAATQYYYPKLESQSFEMLLVELKKTLQPSVMGHHILTLHLLWKNFNQQQNRNSESTV